MANLSFYIANCITRIIMAECLNKNVGQRSDDLADAIRIANNISIEAAHKYLNRLCDEAEAGKYAK